MVNKEHIHARLVPDLGAGPGGGGDPHELRIGLQEVRRDGPAAGEALKRRGKRKSAGFGGVLGRVFGQYFLKCLPDLRCFELVGKTALGMSFELRFKSQAVAGLPEGRRGDGSKRKR